MRKHPSLRLGSLRGTTPELLVSPWYCAWGFCVREEGLPHKTDSPPINAGTAEPFRVSPPEAVAYPLELQCDGKPRDTSDKGHSVNFVGLDFVGVPVAVQR